MERPIVRRHVAVAAQASEAIKPDFLDTQSFKSGSLMTSQAVTPGNTSTAAARHGDPTAKRRRSREFGGVRGRRSFPFV